MTAVQEASTSSAAIRDVHWNAFAEGRLMYQRCGCGHAWLPPRPECPSCLRAEWRWEQASGRGTLVSWVVYRSAYHESFADQMPYNVAIVALDEGPRLITNILGHPDGEGLEIDAPVVFCAESSRQAKRSQFRLASR